MLAVGMAFAALPLFGGTTRLGLLLPPTMILGLLGGTIGVIRGRSVPAVGLFRGFVFGAGLFVAQQGLTLGAALLGGAFTFRFFLAVVFGLFVGLAPIVARVEQNPWFGVRTPWTLGSRRVWRETHRTTGRLWLFGGLLGAGLALFAPLLVSLAYLLFLALAPVGIAYGVWRRMGRP